MEPLLNAFMQDLAQLEQVSFYVETIDHRHLLYHYFISSVKQVNNMSEQQFVALTKNLHRLV